MKFKKTILFFTAAAVTGGILLAAPGAQAITVSLIYTASHGLSDERGPYNFLEDGDLVQLIYAGPDGEIDPPQPWNARPGGDDVLWETTVIGTGTTEPGEFIHTFPTATAGAKVYIRFFNASSTAHVTYYGLSALHTVQDLGGFDYWDMTAGGLYLWTEYPFMVIPEPETWVTLVTALALGIFVFSRRKKNKKEVGTG